MQPGCFSEACRQAGDKGCSSLPVPSGGGCGTGVDELLCGRCSAGVTFTVMTALLSLHGSISPPGFGDVSPTVQRFVDTDSHDDHQHQQDSEDTPQRDCGHKNTSRSQPITTDKHYLR